MYMMLVININFLLHYLLIFNKTKEHNCVIFGFKIIIMSNLIDITN